MKLLLDEMYPPVVADQLRCGGHDVRALVESAELCGQPDADVFAAAQDARLAVVTENVRDFVPLAAEYAQVGRGHHGLVLLDAGTYPRGSPRTVGRMVTALARLLEQRAGEPADSFVCWL